MLTPYDEFPVHQASRPFSFIPATDYSWDDGYYFGVFSPDEGIFIATGARVNPNTDMFGGYAFLNDNGMHHTTRFNRTWRGNFDIAIGPWRVEILEPLKKLRLVLEDNGSGLSFDIIWEGVSPAFEEDHHTAENRGRLTTDQTRYSQPGRASGWAEYKGRRIEITPDTWVAARDHSWGLYAERPPLAPVASLLPPRKQTGPQRAFRFWNCFVAGDYSGFYHLHETPEGEQKKMNDVFGTPLAGHVFKGWDSEPLHFTEASHDLSFAEGTRMLTACTMHLTDDRGGKWRIVYDVAAPPWMGQTMGYHPGSWKDGGTFHTYHGSEDLAIEWDTMDWTVQPFVYTPYKVSGEHVATNFGEGTGVEDEGNAGRTTHGVEYLMKVTLHAPDGSVHTGAAQVEAFINGRFDPYGFE